MPEKADIVIKNGILVTMDKERRVYMDGAVAVVGDKIAAVGKTSEIVQKYKGEYEIDAKGKVVMPGLICSHAHTHGQAVMGMPYPLEEHDFYSELAKWWWPYLEDQLRKEDVYGISRYSIARMAKYGVTTILDVMEAPKDLPGILDSEAKAFLEVGVRGILAFEATERISKENGKLGIQENIDFIKKWNDKDAFVRGMLCVHTVFSCSPEMLKEVRELADEYKSGITLHVEESMYEVEYSLEHFKKRPFEHLRDIGFLGPDVLAAQVVNISDSEIDILQRYGVKVAHNPMSNMEFGVGACPVPKMLNKGITVGLGNDGVETMDMFEVMRFTYIVHKGLLKDTTVIPDIKALEMATIDNAKAVGLEDKIGSLEVGKKADIIVLDLQNATPKTPENIYYLIVILGRGDKVTHTIIDGKIVAENQKLKTVDEEEVNKLALKVSEDIWRRNGFL